LDIVADKKLPVVAQALAEHDLMAGLAE
jgi:hypothetical protein